MAVTTMDHRKTGHGLSVGPNIVKSRFRAHTLLRNGHLQTVFAAVLVGKLPEYEAQKILVPVGQDEHIVVHEEPLDSFSAGAKTLILVHGLGGDHSSPYLRRIAEQARHLGLRTWRIDLKGSGAGLRYAWKPSHAGSSEDLLAVIDHAHRLQPDSPIVVVGFSLSGNILLKLLGELGTRERTTSARIEAALAIGPPVDLYDCSKNMDKFSRKLYTKYYVRNLSRLVSQRRELWPQWNQVSSVLNFRTIRQFDSLYTAPLCGFTSTDEYYELCSARRCVKHIQIPTRVLVDQHDPIVTCESVVNADWNFESTVIETTRHGGHLGYWAMGKRGGIRRWMEDYVCDWISRTGV